MKKDKTTPAAGDVAGSDEELALQSLREAKGITLKDIFAATRITTAYLEAIENGRFEALPEPVYTRTFIKAYARFLEIDSAPLLQRYEDYLHSLRQPTPTGPDKEVLQEKIKAKGKRKKLIAVIVSILLLIGTMAVIVLRESGDGKHRTLPTSPGALHSDTGLPPAGSPPPAPSTGEQTPAAPATPAPEQPVATSPERAIPAPAIPSLNHKKYTLKIEATEKTWVSIAADRGRAEQLTLAAGDSLERAAGESFQIVIGNAGGAKVWFQGQPLPELGKRGEVKHLQLP